MVFSFLRHLLTSREVAPAPQTQSDPNKETIILIHGTFAAPTPDSVNWYDPKSPDSFAAQLNSRLEAMGSTARCWKHLAPNEPLFTWSGHNDWIERQKAAWAIRHQIETLTNSGWRVHLIGHSHGGNIAVDALRLTLIRKWHPESICSICTLGTPFMDTFGTFFGRATTFSRFARPHLTALTTMSFMGYWAFRMLGPDAGLRDILPLLLIAVASVIPYLVVAGPSLERSQERFLESPKVMRWISGKRLLVYTSDQDEALLLLKSVRSLDNPFNVSHGLMRSIFDETRRRRSLLNPLSPSQLAKPPERPRLAFIAIAFAVAALSVEYAAADNSPRDILWAPLLLPTAFVLLLTAIGLAPVSLFYWLTEPLRWARSVVSVVLNIGGVIGSYQFRKRGWFNIQQIALGCEGYPRKLPRVREYPPHVSRKNMELIHLSPIVVNHTVEARSKSAAHWLQGLGKTLQRGGDTNFNVDAQLKLIANDPTLVHSLYLTDATTIQRVADWIIHWPQRTLPPFKG